MILGYFCKQLCCQELSKIAQSGHTEGIYLWSYPAVEQVNEGLNWAKDQTEIKHYDWLKPSHVTCSIQLEWIISVH